MRTVKVLIAGAGPCGLGAARELMECDRTDFLIVDPKPGVGGWAASERTPEGFTFDFGGHVLFPHKHYRRFGQMLESIGIQWASSVPRRGVQVDGRFLPYPAQRNLHRLRPAQMMRAMVSLGSHAMRGNKHAVQTKQAIHGKHAADAKHALHAATGDLGTFLREEFGHYVTQLVMAPLNRKQWAHAPEQLSDGWVRHRSGSSTRNVAEGGIRPLLRNLLLNEDQPGWDNATRVMYPAKGGSGAIWSAVAQSIPAEKILLGVRIVSLSLEEQTATLSNGETIHWKQMISTMPLDTLLRSVSDRPEWNAQANRFRHARSRLFGFGIRGALPERYAGLHSMQVTDAKVPFWRVNFPTTVSAGNGPAGCYSMLCEISEPADKPAEPVQSLRARVEASLTALGLIDGEHVVVSRWERTVDHGYPVPFLGRDAVLEEVQPQLEKAGIFSRGRFGTWRYEISNQDHAFMQGVEVVRWILFGTPEETCPNAGAVNEALPAALPEESWQGGMETPVAVS